MNKKILLTILIILFFPILAPAEEVITGGIKYNEASARIEAFKDLPKKIDKKIFREYLNDPNRKENIKSIEKEKFILDDRELCPFYLKEVLVCYSVSYNDNEFMVFYYNILGHLVRFDIIEFNSGHQRTIGYSRSGNLVNVSFSADTEEQFIYDKNGKLIAHWLGNELVEKKMKFLNITRKGS